MRRLLALPLILVAACTSTVPPASAPTLAERVVGRWEMETVLERGADVTDFHNPGGDRYVWLRADGSFESGGQPYGVNTGRWTLDPGYSELALDSDRGSDNDTYWIVSLDGDVMEWAGVRSERARHFRILSRRVH